MEKFGQNGRLSHGGRRQKGIALWENMNRGVKF